MKNIKIAACFLTLIAGCGNADQVAINQRIHETMLQDQLSYAQSYALASFQELENGRQVANNGVTLKSGSNIGETLAPTFSQLKAMGFAKVNVPGVLVVIEVLPKGCKPGTCSMGVSVESDGRKLSATVPQPSILLPGVTT